MLERPALAGESGGFVGFLIEIVQNETLDLEKEFLLIEDADNSASLWARIKRTRNSKTSYLVPIERLLLKPSRELLARFGHLRELRDRTLLRPAARLNQIEEWFEILLSNNSFLKTGDQVPSVSLHFVNYEPKQFQPPSSLQADTTYFEENPLRFGPNQPSNSDIVDPYQGLRRFGPWDLRQGDDVIRPSSIRPYIIRPEELDLAWRAYHMFNIFENGGYEGDTKSNRFDRSFRGFEREFYSRFEMPTASDSVADCSSDADYLAAADEIIEKWYASEGDPSRLVLVVFPFDQEDDLEDTNFSRNLYPQLKQKFLSAGLPSQMIDRSTLEYIHAHDTLRKTDAKLSLPSNSYFGHILWNIALNIYVKMGGVPWTLYRELDNVNCLIGLSFTVNTLLPNRPMFAGVANVFDEFGEWVDIAPDQR